MCADGRSGSQAKTKTKQVMQLKLAGHDLWHIVGHFDMKKSYEQKMCLKKCNEEQIINNNNNN